MMRLYNEKLIKEWEQLRLKAYLPTPNDRWTIGWGHTSTAKPGMVITEEEAQRLFRRDVAWAEAEVNNYVKVPLTQNQFDALVSFVFNVGAGAWRKSTMLRKLNAGDYDGAAAEFPRWNKQKGKVLRGLVRRRQHEMELFLTPSAREITKIDPIEGGKELKPLTKSREVWTAIGAFLTAIGGFLGPTLMESGVSPSVPLSVALVAFGAYILYNRLVARKNAER